MPRGVEHDDEAKAQAMAALLAGQGVNQVARQFNLPKSTVSRLKNRDLPAHLGKAGHPATSQRSEQVGTDSGQVGTDSARVEHPGTPNPAQESGPSTGDRIDALLLDYLAATLTALKAQARVASDEAYLKKFPPQQIAVLHGVMADKGIRLLEAAARAEGLGEDAGG